jgi:hypothetical protein
MADFLVQSPEGGDLTVNEAGLFPNDAAATDPLNADVYWRKADEPFVSNKHLGTFRVGTDVDFQLNFAEDTDVILTTMTRGPRGQRMFIDPADAPAMVVRIPGIGGGAAPVAFRIQDEGVLLAAQTQLNFIGSAVTAVNNAAQNRTDVTITAGFPNFANQNLGVASRSEINLPLPFLRADDHTTNTWLYLQRVETGCYNAVLDFNCAADPRYYKANWSAGTNSVTIVAGFWDSAGTLANLPAPYYHEGTTHTFRQGQGVRVQGAGAGGSDLFTTISSVAGSVLTLAAVPASNATPGLICHDETSAVQAALNQKRRVHFPTGAYLIYSELRFPQTLSGNYDGVELTGDGERNSVFMIGHDGHAFRMDQAFSGGGLVHVRMRNLGIFACERQNKDNMSTTNRGAGLACTCTTISGSGVPEGDSTDLSLDHIYIQGFGYGVLSQNTQTAYLGHLTVWYAQIAGIALIGNNDDLGTSQKETNAIQIHDSFIQYGRFIQDATQTGTGSVAARSRTLTMGGVSTSRVGCVIKVAGAGVGGRTHVTFIESIAGSTITLSMPCYTASSSTNNVTVYPSNVGNIYLHNANNIEVIGGTHQGNWGKADFTAAINEACGVKAEALTGLRIDNLWYEDVGGENGASIDLVKTRGVMISGCHVGGARKSSPELPSGHGVAVRLNNAEGTEIKGTYFGQSGTGVWLQLLNRCKATRVTSSVVPNPEMYNNTSDLSEPVILADNVICPAGLDLNRGSDRLLDDLWGQALANPRFLDRTGSNPSGWTVVNAAFTLTPSTVTAWVDRFDAYMTVNTQGQAVAGEGDIVTQTVSVPDSDPAGEYVLGFDVKMTSRGAGGGTNDFQSVSIACNLTGSSYPDSSQNFQLSGSSSILFWLSRWQRYHLRVRVGAGTGRTLRVAISATRGGNTPVVQYANFRLQRGRAASHDADGVVTERGGVVRGTFDLAAVTSPPVSAVGRISLANIGGALSQSVNGAAYTAIGGAGAGANIQLSNLSINAGDSAQSNVALNAWLLPGQDAYTAAVGGLLTAVGLGRSDKLLTSGYFLNGVFVYPIGSSTISPKAFGFMGGHATTRGEYFGSEATRFLLLKDRDVLQTGYASRTQLSSYHGIEIRGNRRSDTAPSYSNPSGGNDNLNTVVYSETNCLGFIVDSVPGVVGSTYPIASFRRSNVELARVGWAGELRFSGSLEPGVIHCDSTRPTIFEYEPFTFVRINSLAGARTILLPSPNVIGGTRVVWIRKAHSGGADISVTCVGGALIEDFGATLLIPAASGIITYKLVGINDGSNSGAGTWYRFGTFAN